MLLFGGMTMTTKNRSLMNRMRVISPRMHAPVDYLLVGAFASAPMLLGFGEVATTISLLIAGGYLGMSLFTAYPLGMAKVIPFPVHGTIEMVLAPVMMVLPFLFGLGEVARVFFVVMGISAIAIWAMTDYRAAETDVHQRYLRDRPPHQGTARTA